MMLSVVDEFSFGFSFEVSPFLCSARSFTVRHGLENIFQPGIVEPALFGVGLRQSEGSDQYLVVVGKNGTVFQIGPGQFDRLDGITGKHALVGRLLVSQHDVDELQTIDVACQLGQAKGQRC
jgi:hypothetical protein